MEINFGGLYMTTQVVFLDMDGTILNEDNRVTNYTT